MPPNQPDDTHAPGWPRLNKESSGRTLRATATLITAISGISGQLQTAPGVMPDGIEEEDYPDPADIQAIENLVYGIVPPSLIPSHLP